MDHKSPMLTVAQVKEKYKIGSAVLYRYVRNGYITKKKIGLRSYFSEWDILTWIDLIETNRRKHRPDG